MANIRKTFNFREGVKVDDSVLVVTGSRVGVGTTVPSEVLDVRGRVTITGDLDYSNSVTTGISTFAEVRLGTGVTISSLSGVITATSYYGDGSTLTNLPTSQWTDMDVGLGFTSIYANGNVGVGTTDPRSTFQVGANPFTAGFKGVGIASDTGNIKSSGIISATSFLGDVTGNVIGSADYSTVAGVSTLAGYATSTGISTNANNLTGSPVISIAGLTASGVSTFTGTVSIGSSTTIHDDVTTRYLNTSGISTFGGQIDGNAGADISGTLSAGIGSFGANGVPGVGIGTNNPAADLQILSKKDVSKDGFARIVLGRESAVAGNNAAIGFGNTATGFPYSGGTSFDVLNYGIGNVNFYLEAGTPGVGTGDFHWHRRGNYSRLMSLTYGGSLGIGVTQPVNTLHVVGTSTVTNKAYFGDDVEIDGALSATSLSLTNLVTSNINVTSGISTFYNLRATSAISLGATANPQVPLSINLLGQNRFYVDDSGNAGFGTDATDQFGGINALQKDAILGSVGVGTTAPKCVADFYDAGRTVGAHPGITTTNRFMLLPTVTTTERNAIAAIAIPPIGVGQTALGALVFNETTKKIQFFNGSAWETVTSS